MVVLDQFDSLVIVEIELPAAVSVCGAVLVVASLGVVSRSVSSAVVLNLFGRVVAGEMVVGATVPCCGSDVGMSVVGVTVLGGPCSVLKLVCGEVSGVSDVRIVGRIPSLGAVGRNVLVLG